MRKFVWILVLPALACDFGMSGSGSQSPAGDPGDGSPTIAKVGNGVITANEVKRRLDEQSPFLRARYTTIERKKEFLDNMIRTELLAQEAERRKLDQDPAVHEAIKRLLTQELMKREFDEKKEADAISEEEMKKFYDERISDYVKPERVRVSHIFLAAPAADKKGKAAARAKLQAALKEITAAQKKGEQDAFSKKAKDLSQDAGSAMLGGDLRYQSKEDLERNQGKPFADAAWKLQNPGDLSAIVETDKGLHLVRLTTKQPALDRKYEEVKEQIRSRLASERRRKNFEAYVKQLRDATPVTIDEAELGKIPVDATPPPSPFGMPPTFSKMPVAPGGMGAPPMPPPPVMTPPPPPPAQNTAAAPPQNK
jgi:peptidyl-prolyl cis-trans isomerase C